MVTPLYSILSAFAYLHLNPQPLISFQLSPHLLNSMLGKIQYIVVGTPQLDL